MSRLGGRLFCSLAMLTRRICFPFPLDPCIFPQFHRIVDVGLRSRDPGSNAANRRQFHKPDDIHLIEIGDTQKINGVKRQRDSQGPQCIFCPGGEFTSPRTRFMARPSSPNPVTNTAQRARRAKIPAARPKERNPLVISTNRLPERGMETNLRHPLIGMPASHQ